MAVAADRYGRVASGGFFKVVEIFESYLDPQNTAVWIGPEPLQLDVFLGRRAVCRGVREVLHPGEAGDARLFQDMEVMDEQNGQKPANRATGGSVF